MPRTFANAILYTGDEVVAMIPKDWEFKGLAPEYPKNTKMPFVCGSGHQFRTTVTRILSGLGCTVCHKESRKDLTHVLGKCDTGGFELVSREPEGRFKVVCLERGHSVVLDCFLLKKGCTECRALDRSSSVLESYRQLLSMEGFINVEVVGHGIKAGAKVRFTCPKGHITEMPASRLSSGKRCTACNSPKKPGESDIQLSLAAEGWTLAPGREYKNNRSPLLMCCPKGHQTSLTWNRWSKGYRCGVCHPGKAMTRQEIINRINSSSHFLYVDGADEYQEHRDQSTKFRVECKKRGHVTEVSFSGIIYERRNCSICNASTFTSKAENELADLIEAHCPIIRQDRTVLVGQELDIFVPRLNLAVEYCGLYSHSDVFKTPDYHLNKWKACRDLGITLITVFEDEYVHRGELVRSLLLSRIGVAQKVDPSGLSRVSVGEEEATKFLEENTLGYLPEGRPGASWGLVSAELCLVEVCSLYRENSDWLVVTVTKAGVLVETCEWWVGLLNSYRVRTEDTRMLARSDNRWPQEDKWLKAGFVVSERSAPRFSFVRGTKRVNEKRLAGKDARKIWDCGITTFTR